MAAKLTLSLSESSVSVANNTSVVTGKLYYYGNGESWSNYARSGYIIIDGSKKTFTHTFSTSTSAQLLATYSVTVTHNSNGAKSISASGQFATQAYPGTLTVSTSKTLTTIPRATTPSVDKASVVYGTDVVISLPRASSSFTHTIEVGIDGQLSWTAIATGVGTSYTWTVPKDYAQYITTTANDLMIRVTTYNGSSSVGNKTITIKLVPSADMVPTIADLSITDAMGYATTFGGYVRGQSKYLVNFMASGYQGSTIASQQVIANGATYTSVPATTEVVKNTTESVKSKATDSRGMSTTIEQTPTIYDWSAPVISAFVANRCAADGTLKDDGAYAIVTYTYAISPVNDLNSKTVKVLYKHQSDSVWTEQQLTLQDYSGSGSIVFACDTEHSFDVKLQLIDSFVTSESDMAQLGTAFTLMDFHSSGRGMAFGKVAETEDLVEIDMPVQFNSAVTGINCIKTYQNVTCSASSAVSDSTYADYPYRIDLAISGATSDFTPVVCVPAEDAAIICSESDIAEGIVKVWAKNNTFGTITIPVILLLRDI